MKIENSIFENINVKYPPMPQSIGGIATFNWPHHPTLFFAAFQKTVWPYKITFRKG